MLKIKIVHVIENLHFGGAQRFVIDLCNEMANIDKYDVYLLSLEENYTEDSLLSDVLPQVNYISFKKRGKINISTLIKLTYWLKSECPHIVHSHLNAYEYLSIYRLFETRTSFFHTIHKPVQLECSNLVLKKFRANSYRYNQVTPISISQNSSKSFREYYKLNNDVVIQHARLQPKVSSAQVQVRTGHDDAKYSFLLLHIGNIDTGKNQQLLVRAIQLYNLTAKRKCRLLMIGEVKDQKVYCALREMLLHDQNIEFIGAKHNVADYLSIADGFCLSSTWEGLPMALIEAMAMGCIPICTPAGAIKEIIVDGVTGFVSKDVDVDSYCKALKRALEYPNREVLRENIKEVYQKRFDIRGSASKHINLYKRALNLFEGRDNAFELLYKSKI
jgi:glycosyltransferase involved in cell wall biosynthesis